MGEASIILPELSKTYLNPDRCAVEWKLAASLANGKQVAVIMGSVKPCSHPKSLKKLNSMDQERSEFNVFFLLNSYALWGRNICSTVQGNSNNTYPGNNNTSMFIRK